MRDAAMQQRLIQYQATSVYASVCLVLKLVVSFASRAPTQAKKGKQPTNTAQKEQSQRINQK